MKSESWEGLEPAPMEYFHGKMMDYFHEYRLNRTDSIQVPIDGVTFNNIIAKAKTDTYAKYPKQNLCRAIPKSEM